jgi:hypothetical protein
MLHVWYGGANLDLNRNSVVDANDVWTGRTQLGLWYETAPGDGWQKSGAAHVWDDRYFSLAVPHFSGYAVSW